MNTSPAEEKETGRIEAFSDGVFAIAITLLVLELKIPHLGRDATNSDLLWTLIDEWPAFMAYVISFVTILISWINHHRLFSLIRKTDGPFMLLNGLLLMVVTVMPFPTSLLSDYFGHDASKMACVVFAATYFALGLAYNFIWHYAALGRRLLRSSVTREQIKTINRNYVLGPVAYGLALIAAFFSGALSIGLIAMTVIFYTIFTYGATSVESAP